MNWLNFDGSDLNTTDKIFSTVSTCCELTRRGTSSFKYLAMLIKLSSLQVWYIYIYISKIITDPFGIKCGRDVVINFKNGESNSHSYQAAKVVSGKFALTKHVKMKNKLVATMKRTYIASDVPVYRAIQVLYGV